MAVKLCHVGCWWLHSIHACRGGLSNITYTGDACDWHCTAWDSTLGKNCCAQLQAGIKSAIRKHGLRGRPLPTALHRAAAFCSAAIVPAAVQACGAQKHPTYKYPPPHMLLDQAGVPPEGPSVMPCVPEQCTAPTTAAGAGQAPPCIPQGACGGLDIGYTQSCQQTGMQQKSAGKPRLAPGEPGLHHSMPSSRSRESLSTRPAQPRPSLPGACHPQGPGHTLSNQTTPTVSASAALTSLLDASGAHAQGPCPAVH